MQTIKSIFILKDFNLIRDCKFNWLQMVTEKIGTTPREQNVIVCLLNSLLLKAKSSNTFRIDLGRKKGAFAINMLCNTSKKVGQET